MNRGLTDHTTANLLCISLNTEEDLDDSIRVEKGQPNPLLFSFDEREPRYHQPKSENTNAHVCRRQVGSDQQDHDAKKGFLCDDHSRPSVGSVGPMDLWYDYCFHLFLDLLSGAHVHVDLPAGIGLSIPHDASVLGVRFTTDPFRNYQAHSNVMDFAIHESHVGLLRV